MSQAKTSEELKSSLAGYSGSPRRTVSDAHWRHGGDTTGRSGSGAGGTGAASRTPLRQKEASQRWQMEANLRETMTDAQRRADNHNKLLSSASRAIDSSSLVPWDGSGAVEHHSAGRSTVDR